MPCAPSSRWWSTVEALVRTAAEGLADVVLPGARELFGNNLLESLSFGQHGRCCSGASVCKRHLADRVVAGAGLG